MRPAVRAWRTANLKTLGPIQRRVVAPHDALPREVVMNRTAFAPAFALLVCSAVATSTFAQAQTAAPTTPAPAAKAGFVTPLKGEAVIQVLPGSPKFDPKAKEV